MRNIDGLLAIDLLASGRGAGRELTRSSQLLTREYKDSLITWTRRRNRRPLRVLSSCTTVSTTSSALIEARLSDDPRPLEILRAIEQIQRAD